MSAVIWLLQESSANSLTISQTHPMHDLWLGIVGEFLFKTYFIPDKLLLYRRHDSNASQTGFKSPFTPKQKIKFRLNVIRYLPLLVKRKFFNL
jgi:hypothetical protein